MAKDELMALEELNASFEKRLRRLDAETGKALANEIGHERKRLKRFRKTSSILANLSLALVILVLPLGRVAAADRSNLPLLLVGGAGIGATFGLIYAEIGKARFARNLLSFSKSIRGRNPAKSRPAERKKRAEPCPAEIH